jgi:hypothetical protein
MIQMGRTSGCSLSGNAKGEVSVEDLVLDANSEQIDGVDNVSCQELSFVSHVTVYRATGVGLSVAAAATNSGPYSDITFDTKNVTPNGSTECANIAATTRGIQHMTCTTGATADTVADGISIAAQGNSVEDVRIEGFATGVSVAASNNVLINILGDSNPQGASSPVSVVSIASGMSNVALMGITNNCTSNCTYSTTVADNATNAQLTHTSDPSVAMYVLGNCTTPSSCTTSSAYSRYTTSTSVANWSVGTTGTPVTGGCAARGSLYSNRSASASPALYVCSAVGTNPTWQIVK